MRHLRDVRQGNKAVCGARLARHSGHVPAYDRADVECHECRAFMLRESMKAFQSQRTMSDIVDSIMARIPAATKFHFEYVNVIAQLINNEIEITEEATEKTARRFLFETE